MKSLHNNMYESFMQLIESIMTSALLQSGLRWICSDARGTNNIIILKNDCAIQILIYSTIQAHDHEILKYRRKLSFEPYLQAHSHTNE